MPGSLGNSCGLQWDLSVQCPTGALRAKRLCVGRRWCYFPLKFWELGERGGIVHVTHSKHAAEVEFQHYLKRKNKLLSNLLLVANVFLLTTA